MAQAGVQVQLSLKEIYVCLCPQCQAKLKVLIKDKITDNLVKGVIE